MGIAEKLITIAENEQKVYRAGQLNVLSNTECLQGNKSGSIVSIADISPIEHNVGVLVEHPKEGVNLLENATFEVREINEEYHDIFLCSSPFHLEDDKEYIINFPNATDLDNTIYIAGADWNTSNYNPAPILDTEFPYSFIPINLCDPAPESREYRIFIYSNNSTNIDDYIDTTGATLMGVGYVPAANEKVYVGGANLLNLDRTLGTLKSGASGKRTDFKFDKYYEGITRTNVYIGSAHATATIEDGVITINTKTAWYGIGIPFKVKPNTQYILKGKYTGDKPYVRVAFYDENGNWLCESTTVFTTPETCTVAMLSIVGQSNNSVVTATNLQLEYGTTATEYMPYIEPTEYTSNADGVVEGVKSIYPTTVISAENEGVIITADYYKDIDKVINGLTADVALSGGE